MLRFPKVCTRLLTVAAARALFGDDHVHCLLVVEDGRLLAVVERHDLEGADPRLPAWPTGRLSGRVVRPGADLETTRQAMLAEPRRRLAVVGDGGELLGLLCLKRTGSGFCSDADVRARAAERGRV